MDNDLLNEARSLLPGRGRGHWSLTEGNDPAYLHPYSRGMWVIRVEDYLHKFTGKQWRFSKQILKDGDWLRYRWKSKGKPRGALFQPFFLMKIRYNKGTDLFDIETEFVDHDGNVLGSKTLHGMYVDNITDPEVLFGWAAKKWNKKTGLKAESLNTESLDEGVHPDTLEGQRAAQQVATAVLKGWAKRPTDMKGWMKLLDRYGDTPDGVPSTNWRKGFKSTLIGQRLWTESKPTWASAAAELIKKRTGRSQDDLHYRAYLRAIVQGNQAQAKHMRDTFPGAKEAGQDLIDRMGLAAYGESLEEGEIAFTFEKKVRKAMKGMKTGETREVEGYKITKGVLQAQPGRYRRVAHTSTYSARGPGIHGSTGGRADEVAGAIGLAYEKTQMEGVAGAPMPFRNTEFADWVSDVRQQIKAPSWTYPDWALPKGDLEEALDPKKFAKAQGLARLLKKAGTSAKDAKDRIQKKYGLSDNELKAVLRSIWGKTETAASAEFGNWVSEIRQQIKAPSWTYPDWALPKVQLDEAPEVPEQWARGQLVSTMDLNDREARAALELFKDARSWEAFKSKASSSSLKRLNVGRLRRVFKLMGAALK